MFTSLRYVGLGYIGWLNLVKFSNQLKAKQYFHFIPQVVSQFSSLYLLSIFPPTSFDVSSPSCVQDIGRTTNGPRFDSATNEVSITYNSSTPCSADPSLNYTSTIVFSCQRGLDLVRVHRSDAQQQGCCCRFIQRVPPNKAYLETNRPLSASLWPHNRLYHLMNVEEEAEAAR